MLDPVALALAFGAGVLSFASPCVLPLVPAYMGYITGASLDQWPQAPPWQARRRMLAQAVAFVLGLAAVFSMLGATAGVVGQLLLDYRDVVTKVAGVMIVVFGLHVAGVLRIPLLYREKRVDFTAFRGGGPASAFVMGLAFGVGWTPCVGAALGSLLLLAGQSETVWQGAALLFAYALGLGLPFVLATLLLGRALGWLPRLKQQVGALSAASGALLVLIGGLVFTDRFGQMAAWLTQVFGTGLTL